LLLGVHDFGGATPCATRHQINLPTLQSYRLWSLLSARHHPWRYLEDIYICIA